MPTLRGEHRQSSTTRLLNYWATFCATQTEVVYCAVIREGKRLVDTPDFNFAMHRHSPAPDEVVRQHLIDYMDAMPFGSLQVPQPTRTAWLAEGPETSS